MTSRLVAYGALAVLLLLPATAGAFGLALGLDSDLAQLDTGLRDSDPASNGPAAWGAWIPMVESNSVYTPPSASVRIAHPSVRIGTTVRSANRVLRAGPMRVIVTP